MVVTARRLLIGLGGGSRSKPLSRSDSEQTHVHNEKLQQKVCCQKQQQFVSNPVILAQADGHSDVQASKHPKDDEKKKSRKC